MAKHRRQRVRRHDRAVGSALRPVAWSALFGAIMASAVSAPVYAEPLRPYTAPGSPGNAPGTPATVPDSGLRPTPAGQLRLPGAATTTPVTSFAPTAGSSLAAQIQNKRVAIAAAGEQLLRLQEERVQAAAQVTTAAANLRQAQETLARALAAAEVAAADSLKDAAALPPGTFGSELHGLGALSRLHGGDSSSQEAAAREVARAESARQAADTEHTAAASREQALVTQFTTAEAARRRDEAALLELQRQDSGQLAEYLRDQEAENRRLGAPYLNSPGIAGQAAHPKAVAAVRYALAQLGDAYVWSEEGPDQFDCSGLMYAAYRRYAADPYPLPRVSRDQYYATRANTVDRNSLLPGDLIFFSSSSSWTGIHHVGMYVGNGKMVHAPNSQEPVQVSTIWWSEYFAATRIYGAVPATDAPPAPEIPPAPEPRPRPRPTPKPIPTPPKPGTTPGTTPTTPPTSKPPTSAVPTTPSDPGTPDNPGTPSTPGTPSDPGTPSTPAVSPSETPSPTPAPSSAAAATAPSATGSSGSSGSPDSSPG